MYICIYIYIHTYIHISLSSSKTTYNDMNNDDDRLSTRGQSVVSKGIHSDRVNFGTMAAINLKTSSCYFLVETNNGINVSISCNIFIIANVILHYYYY